MKSFSIKQTKHTPLVAFDVNDMSLTIEGYSIPEDVSVFYAPLLEFIDQNAQLINSSSKKLSLSLNLEYFNSASLKFYVKLIGILVDIKGRHSITVDYYYDKDDEDFYETGVDISAVLNIPFNFVTK